MPVLVSADKAKQELGWVPRPAREPIVVAAKSLIHHGIVLRRPGPLLAGAATVVRV